MRRYSGNVARVVAGLVVVVGSIVTFYFGLQEGSNPSVGGLIYCDFACGRIDSVKIGKHIGTGEWFTLILMTVGAFLLLQTIMGWNTAGQNRRRREKYNPNPWAIPEAHWVTTVSAKQAGASRARTRPGYGLRVRVIDEIEMQ